MASDDDDETLVQFLESEILSETSDQEDVKEEDTDLRQNLDEEEVEMRKEEEENEEEEEKEVNKMLIEEGCISCEDEDRGEGDERVLKRRRVEEVENKRPFALTACNMLSSVEPEAAPLSSEKNETAVVKGSDTSSSDMVPMRKMIKLGSLGKMPHELFRNILKFLSSEDLVSCSLACRSLNLAASDESLWRRLYSLRWGLLPPKTLRESAWKKLYIQRDEEDMVESVRNCPQEFKEYYIQMQTAKRSQAPLPSQVIDDRVIIDKTVTDQVSTWKRSKGLTDKVVSDHACSGVTCTYFHIGDAFICEKTGNVHVCGDTCKEVVADSANELLVCTISGRCFDRLLSPAEMEPEEQQQGSAADEAEVFMGSGRFARAYQLGYDCADEKELEATWRFC